MCDSGRGTLESTLCLSHPSHAVKTPRARGREGEGEGERERERGRERDREGEGEKDKERESSNPTLWHLSDT